MTDKMAEPVYSSKYGGRTALIAIIASILISIMALSSCSRADSILGEYRVPDTYTTFTDNNRIFSISYPSDWVAQTMKYPSQDELDSLSQYLEDSDSPDVPQTKIEWYLFYATARGKVSSYTGMNLIAYRLPQEQQAKEDFYDKTLQTRDYKTSLVETTRIAGREVSIFKLHSAVLLALEVNKTLFLASAGGDSQYEKDFQIIVRSLRVLK